MFGKLKSLIASAALLLLLTASKPVKVACIGDSITFGSKIEDKEHDSYPAVLGSMLGEGYEVINFGIGARCMLSTSDHPYMIEDKYRQVKEFLPDIVTIMLGTNDSKYHNWTGEDAFLKDYSTMVEEMKSLPSHPKVYICLPPWVAEGKWGINDSTVVTSINPVLLKIANRYWLDIIDTHSTLLGQPDMYADGVHPKEQGARKLAETIYGTLAKNGDTLPQGKRIMFIGDSITDGDWAKKDATPSGKRNHYDMNHLFGHGYQALCAGYYLDRYPSRRYKFYNRGFSGDKLEGMAARWEDDVLAVHPDVISILIGTNDCLGHDAATYDFAGWEKTYRELLDKSIAVNPDVKFALCTPFVYDIGFIHRNNYYGKWQEMAERFRTLIKEIADDYGAVVVPFDQLLDKLVANDRSHDEKYWVWDGIHPTYPAHEEMARLWIKKAGKLLK